MEIEKEDEERGFFYFDSQWDVIRRGTAQDFKDSLDRYKDLNDGRLISYEGFFPDNLPSDKFLPVLDESHTNTKEFELFENNSGCVCPLNTDEIDKVAEALLGPNSGVNAHLQPAGYTYFAQLLTHDIVSSTSLLRNRNASCVLNLDSIYFEYDQISAWQGVDNQGKFVLTNSDSDFYRSEWQADVLRKPPHDLSIPHARVKPYFFSVIPEHRNDGNVILSQLHVALLKLHNEIVELLAEKVEVYKGHKEAVKGREYYEKAQKIVVLLFQKVTVDDLLKVTLDHDTFDYYFEHGGPSLFPDLRSKDTLPKEFTHAVSRYAHSMIRPSYELNKDQGSFDINELFNKNSRLGDFAKNLRISDWRLFFSRAWEEPHGGGENKANKILLKAASLPISRSPIEPWISERNPAKNLATFDIKASAELCTFSSVMRNQKIQGFFKNVKGIDDIEKNYFNKIDYKRINTYLSLMYGDISLNNNNAPFIVSMYLESKAMPQEHNYDRLGVIGSIVYAETIRFSIENAPVNIYQDELDLKNSLGWAYPIYQFICSSLIPLDMLELTTINKLRKRGKK